MNLSRLNLNLLPGLKALLDTQSVSKAAQVMCVSQSAMSRTLAQLREALNDPILIRKGNRIFLSEKARELHIDVNRVVSEASSIFENQQFDIGTASRHFRIAAGHMVLEKVMPSLLQKIWQQAPGLSFELQAINPSLEVATGNLDILVGHIGDQEEGLSRFDLMEEKMVLILCENHPLAHEAFSLEALCQFPFVLQKSEQNLYGLHYAGGQAVSDDVTVKVFSPSMPVSLELIRGSDKVYLAAASALAFSQSLEGFVVRDIPGESPKVTYSMAWPDYWELNRAHRWVREFIRDELVEIISQREEDILVDLE